MYQCDLLIHILSKDASLERELRKTVPPERFSLFFHTYFTVCEESLANCQVLIWDLPGCELPAVLSRIPPAMQVIICAEPQAMAAAQEACPQCAGFWVKPFSPAFAIARLGRLLAELKLGREYRLAQSYLETAINSIPDLVWFKDMRGAHVKVNDAFCHTVGKAKQDVLGRGHYYIWDLEPEEYAKGEYVCLETEEEVLRARKTCLFDEKVKSKHGLRQFKTYKSPIFGDEGDLLGTVGIAHDVTDLENIGTELEIILNSMPFAILVKNREGTIINTNETFTVCFLTPREQILGQNYDAWKKKMLSKVESQRGDGAEITLRITGEIKIFDIREEPIYDIFENLVGQICIYRDVTVERTLEQRILHNSNTDFMTGLYNRRYFYDYIVQNRGAQRVSLIYVDLDHFKHVNDNFGHQAGDEALILTAKLLNECFSDAFIARLGGDEFLITLLGPWSSDELEVRSRQLLRQMSGAFSACRQWSILTASIGIAQTDDPNIKIDTLMQQSDHALYTAKQSGRARCCVYSEDGAKA